MKSIPNATLISRTDELSDASHYYWLAKCHCGNEFKARKADVIKGRSKTCGCYQKPRTNFRDYTGHSQHYLYVVREAGTTEAGLLQWEAVCTYKGCGTVFITSSEMLRKGLESCGCKARADTTISQATVKRLLAKRQDESSRAK